MDKLMNLSYIEKIMYKKSMEKFYKDEAEKYGAIFGKGDGN
ncbi:hypothetical protein HNQ80_001044 [Anaerosolibacter carboniphilus]|uniref:Uncharacterized protein n=1 Tax=Anaerosolibacter carboniphilus TaxID=1417629 RepID=A0A841KXR2_9FIRM|nr:hypothetical protein [Anaerosolibacter carboniphilus]MBB6214959.1 hypothetical protein [Anaerosolibacter carboniphilus]